MAAFMAVAPFLAGWYGKQPKKSTYTITAKDLGGCLDVPVPERSALVKKTGFFSKGKRFGKVSICCAPWDFFKQSRS